MGMALSASKGKNGVKPDMNVTPLVDVVLVLLIIFMVLAPVMTEAFYARVPPKDDTDKQLDDANDPNKPLVLSVAEDGSIDVNSVKIDRSELPVRLHRMFNTRIDNVLYVDGADEVPYGLVLTAVDLSREGGAGPVVIVTKKLK